MTPIVFSDLDDTVFQTARKMRGDPRPQLLASRAGNGSHSYMNDAQAVMIDWLIATTRFIPVTARSAEALGRCTLPFRDFRVASNGAVILREDNSLDRDWMERTRRISGQNADGLRYLEGLVAARNESGGLRHWIVEEEDCPVYLCVKSNGPESRLDEIETVLSEDPASRRMTIHRNGNNLSFTPREISKCAAVEHLIHRIGAADRCPIWGMGDSLTDLPFMEVCQMMVIPTGSQLHEYLKERG